MLVLRVVDSANNAGLAKLLHLRGAGQHQLLDGVSGTGVTVSPGRFDAFHLPAPVLRAKLADRIPGHVHDPDSGCRIFHGLDQCGNHLRQPDQAKAQGQSRVRGYHSNSL